MPMGGVREQPVLELEGLVAAAHELKTPLTLIMQLALCAQDATLLDATQREKALERIHFSAERSLRLVQGLTLGYRLQQSDQLAFAFRCEPLNIVQICEETIHELAPLAQAQAQTIHFDSTKYRTKLVVGNRELLRSLLGNLLDNAMKHTPVESTVRVDLALQPERVRVGVSDNGPGVTRATLQRLDQTLGVQAQPLTGRAGTSGLGLYIASSMAEAMGGKVGVGRPSFGTRFYVELLRSKQLSFL
jgi:signal transduction histidine kinase